MGPSDTMNTLLNGMAYQVSYKHSLDPHLMEGEREGLQRTMSGEIFTRQPQPAVSARSRLRLDTAIGS